MPRRGMEQLCNPDCTCYAVRCQQTDDLQRAVSVGLDWWFGCAGFGHSYYFPIQDSRVLWKCCWHRTRSRVYLDSLARTCVGNAGSARYATGGVRRVVRLAGAVGCRIVFGCRLVWGSQLAAAERAASVVKLGDR